MIKLMKNEMKAKRLLVTALMGAQFVLPALAANAPATSPADAQEISELKKEIEALEQKVNALEQRQNAQTPAAKYEALDQKVRSLLREHELDAEAAAVAVKSQPTISLGASGFSFSSADSNFVAQLHGLVQLDSRSFFQDGGLNGNDGFLLRRARPIFSGTVFRDFDFNFTPDFGGSTVQILDAYLNYRYNSALQLEAGKFKSQVGAEHLEPCRDIFV